MPYGLQAQVYRHLRAARPLPGGRVLKLSFQAMWRHIVQINDETPWHLPLWIVPRRHNPAYSLRYAFFIPLLSQRPQLFPLHFSPQQCRLPFWQYRPQSLLPMSQLWQRYRHAHTYI